MSVQSLATERQSRGLRLGAGALAAALTGIVWTVGVVSLFVWPSGSGDVLRTPADYADPALLTAGVIATIAALSVLDRRQQGLGGRLGQIGYWLTVGPLALMAIQSVVEIVVGHEALGILFVAGGIGSRLGLIVWGIASFRAGVLPRWFGPALALAWLIFPPLGPMVAAVVWPATWLAGAVGLGNANR